MVPSQRPVDRMKRRQPTYQDKLRAAKRSNDMMADLSGKPRLDYTFNDKPLIREPVKRAPRSPDLPREPSEHEIQSAVIEWWLHAHKTYSVPRFALAAIPNAQILMGSANNAARVMAYLHKEGFRDGAPDLMLSAARGRYHGLFIEMKSRKGVIRPEQIEWITHLEQQGYYATVCRTSETAIDTIKGYLAV